MLSAASVSVFAIGANNVTRGANYVERNGEGYVVRAGGLIETVDQIRDVVVATRAGGLGINPVEVNRLGHHGGVDISDLGQSS